MLASTLYWLYLLSPLCDTTIEVIFTTTSYKRLFEGDADLSKDIGSQCNRARAVVAVDHSKDTG